MSAKCENVAQANLRKQIYCRFTNLGFEKEHAISGGLIIIYILSFGRDLYLDNMFKIH